MNQAFVDYKDLSFEYKIFYFLLSNDKYRTSVVPILKAEYFTGIYVHIFKTIRELVAKKDATVDMYVVYQELRKSIMDKKEALKKISEFFIEIDNLSEILEKNLNVDYFMEETETWAKDIALKKAIYDSVEILETDKDKVNTLPGLFSEALSISLDKRLGLDYLNTLDERLERYKTKEDKVRFLIPRFNKVTNGGFTRKTLNVLMSPTNRGKTSVMCSMSADYIKLGYNVLYVTLEMNEYEIGARIDANLLNVQMDKLEKLGEVDGNKAWSSFVESCEGGKPGILHIREFPTSSINALNIKALLKEFQQKENFKPDVLVIDYINLMNPVRSSKDDKSYEKVKCASEELRGLAVEFGLVILTATQTNRSGMSSDDLGLENTSESVGLPFTADFVAALFSGKELRESNLMVVKVIKSRYSGYVDKQFPVGMDFSYCKMFGLNEDEEKKIAANGIPGLQATVSRPLR